jgi:hypothetical protein
MTVLPSRPPASTHAPATGRPPGPDPARLAGLLARTWFEVRSGRRPLHQLAPLVTPAVRRRLAGTLRQQDAPPGGSVAIRRIVTTSPAVDVHEAVVLVDQGHRTTAVAIRLERRRGRWRAVDLTAPEDGLPALLPPPLRQHEPDAFDEAEREALQERSG